MDTCALQCRFVGPQSQDAGAQMTASALGSHAGSSREILCGDMPAAEYGLKGPAKKMFRAVRVRAPLS